MGLDQAKLLEFAAHNFLSKANDLKCESLSIPAISCGEHGFSKKLCSMILYQAIQMFQQGTSPYKVPENDD